MAGSQILHIELGPDVDAQLRRHYSGEIRYATSEPREDWPAVVLADPNEYPAWAGREHGPTAGQALIDRLRPTGRGRPTKNLRVDMILGGPPPFESVDGTKGWDQERVMRWFRMSMQHLSESLPDAIVEHAALHLDERSPHIHFAAVNLNATENRVGWTFVRQGLSGKKPRLVDGEWKEPWAKTHFTGIHDNYYRTVSKHFGLTRDSGERKGERVDQINREHGEVLRAAAGGFSERYMASANADVRWAAEEGERMRADPELTRQDGLKAPIDLDHELLRRYSERFPDHKLTITLPRADKTALAAAKVDRGEAALDARAARLAADRKDLDRRAAAVERREAALADREAGIELEAVLQGRHADEIDTRAADLQVLASALDDRNRDLDRRDRALEDKLADVENRAAATMKEAAALRGEFERQQGLRGQLAAQMGDVLESLHDVADRLEAAGETAWGPLLRPVVRLLRTLTRLAPDETLHLDDPIEDWRDAVDSDSESEGGL